METTYQILYPFELEENISKGNICYMVDRANTKIECVNCMSAEKYISVKKYDKKDGRYEFYAVIEVKRNDNM